MLVTVVSFNKDRKMGFVLLMNSRNWAAEVLTDDVWSIILDHNP